MAQQLVTSSELSPNPMPPADFRDELYRATPVAYVTPVLVGLNIAVFVAMLFKGVPFLQPTAHDVVPWGANFGPLTASGQWWRLLAACFVHFGIIHIAVNMYVLLQVGSFTERLFGNLRYALLYLLAGIGGNIAGLYVHPFAVGAGASGAIFGVFGGLLGFLLVQRGVVPRKAASGIATSAGIFIAYNLIYGLMRPETDQVAHIGGIVTGFIVGCVLATPLETGIGHLRPVRATVVGVVGALLAVVACRHVPKENPEEAQWYEKILTAPIVTVGHNDRVAYRGTATPADAQRMAQALLKDGLFQPADVIVLLERDSSGATLSIPLRPNAGAKSDSWTDPGVLNSIRTMGPTLATAAGGPPLKIWLLTDKGIAKNQLDIKTGEVVVGGRDRVIYSGAVAAQQAAALGVALEQAGFFRGQGAAVVATRNGPKAAPELTFLVAADAPHDPRILQTVTEVSRRVAPTVGGLPVVARLVDASGEVRGEQTVQ